MLVVRFACPHCGRGLASASARHLCACGHLVDVPDGPAAELRADVVTICGPPEPWPAWALAAARLRRDGEVGVGETIERLAALAGGEYYKRALEAIGIDCGCASRRDYLNALYHYPPPPTV